MRWPDAPDDYYDEDPNEAPEEMPEEEFYAMYDAFEPVLKAVMAAEKRERDPISDSDLIDEQPITLTIHCTLGDVRKARSHMRHDPPQEEEIKF